MFASRPPEPKPIAKANVLVVEDKKFTRELLHRLLKKIGVAQVFGAWSAEDALFNLKKSPRMADVLLLDFGLPGISGLKFLQQIRAENGPKVLQNLPVVVITGETDPRLFQEMSELKISGFLLKPVGETALRDALERALRNEAIAPAVMKGELEVPQESPPPETNPEAAFGPSDDQPPAPDDAAATEAPETPGPSAPDAAGTDHKVKSINVKA